MTPDSTKSALTEHGRIPWLILITGAPATGKTTVGAAVAARLCVPFITKDAIKECLFDTLGWSDREWSKRLGIASYALLYDFVEAHLRVGASLVVEANFKPRYDSARFLALRERYPFSLLQLVLRAPSEVLQSRFAARARAGGRHPGHVDIDFESEFAAQLEAGLYGPLDVPGTVLEVDTTYLDTASLAGMLEKVY